MEDSMNTLEANKGNKDVRREDWNQNMLSNVEDKKS